MQRATPDRSSRQGDLLSPRRLDQLRTNGKNILDGQQAAMNNADAASTYKRVMEQQRISGVQNMGITDARENDREAEITMNKKLHLVPSRWERSGWRYVERDPADHGFFKNPNRVNNFGITAEKQRFSSQRRDSQFQTTNKSSFGNPTRQAGETTYGRFFADAASAPRNPSTDAAPWKQDQVNKNQDGIQWAGESHKRQTFRKTKDYIGDWTNVLFRA